MKFKYSMTLSELRKRTSKKYYKKIDFLKPTSREIKGLSKDDLLVLCHLTRAAFWIEKVHYQLENSKNLQLLQFLDSEIEKNSEKARLAKKMFLSQKSNFSPDRLGNQTEIFKDIKRPLGLAYFPNDLEETEFHEIINKMLDDGESEEVSKILNQRSIVVRNGTKLRSIDFVEAFVEFKEVARELREACKFSKNKKFNDFLELQARALEEVNPMLDAYADKAWAELDEKCKYEFTITRECYQENLTKTIFDNEALLTRLTDAGITVYAKDSLGARVGLVNKTGTRKLKKLKELVNIAAKFMPYQEKYSQKKSSDLKQIAVDVDLVALTGDEGAYRASITTAQNLPNDDKLSFSIGGGNRNVYHRQVRKTGNKKNFQKLLHEDFWKYYNPEADHWAVICHENTHSLGPNSKGLGKFSLIIEEFKADMGMYAFLDEFKNANYFSDDDIKQIMVTGIFRCFMKGKPTLQEAHKTRALMICNRLLTDKAIILDNSTKIRFDFEKVKATTKQMLAEAVRLQIDKNVKNAENYILKWAVWSEDIDRIAEVIRSYSKALNGYVNDEMAQEFMKQDYEKSLA